MRRLITILAIVALGLWSLFAWAVYGLLGYAGEFAAANAELLLIPPEWANWGAALFSGAGGVVIWIVWFLGAALIAVLALIASRLLAPRDRGAGASYREGGEPFGRDHADRETYDGGPLDRSPIDHRPLDQRPVEPVVGRTPGNSADDVIARVLGKPPRR